MMGLGHSCDTVLLYFSKAFESILDYLTFDFNISDFLINGCRQKMKSKCPNALQLEVGLRRGPKICFVIIMQHMKQVGGIDNDDEDGDFYQGHFFLLWRKKGTKQPTPGRNKKEPNISQLNPCTWLWYPFYFMFTRLFQNKLTSKSLWDSLINYIYIL